MNPEKIKIIKWGSQILAIQIHVSSGILCHMQIKILHTASWTKSSHNHLFPRFLKLSDKQDLSSFFFSSNILGYLLKGSKEFKDYIFKLKAIEPIKYKRVSNTYIDKSLINHQL